MQKQPSAASDSVQPESQPLCRAVFDELMDKDLLGVLLSVKHFRMFLVNARIESSEALASQAQAIASSPEQAKQLQLDILKMFGGVYIAECRIESERELHAALDVKLHEALIDVYEDNAGTDSSIEVELAWRYRRTCSFGRPIAF